MKSPAFLLADSPPLALLVSLYAFTTNTSPNRAAKGYAMESASNTFGSVGEAVVAAVVAAEVGALVAVAAAVLGAAVEPEPAPGAAEEPAPVGAQTAASSTIVMASVQASAPA